MSNSPLNTDYVRTYLTEIGRHPLLTRDQEMNYGHQVQQMMFLKEAKDTLSKKLRREATLSEWSLHVKMTEAELIPKMNPARAASKK